MPPGLQYHSPGGMSYVMPNECLGGIFNTSDEACACAGAGVVTFGFGTDDGFCGAGAEVECEIVDVKEAFAVFIRCSLSPIYCTWTAVYVKE